MILQIIEKMNEGGAVFTYPILATSIAVTIYFIKALRNNLRINGLAKLIASYGWFVFAWGSLGSAFGLIFAFDTLKTKIISTLTAPNCLACQKRSRILLLTIDPPIPTNKEIEQGSYKWQEDDKQNPNDLLISIEIIHQGRD